MHQKTNKTHKKAPRACSQSPFYDFLFTFPIILSLVLAFFAVIKWNNTHKWHEESTGLQELKVMRGCLGHKFLAAAL